MCYTVVAILSNETIFRKYQEAAPPYVVLKNLKHREIANILFMFTRITDISSINDNNIIDGI